jgi:hypothetical protein
VGDRLSGIATSGPLAHSVADAAALLDVMSGYVIGDPYWLPDPNPSFLTVAQQVQKLERSPAPLRIAFMTGVPPMGDADPICQQAVLKTVQLLEEMGHQVEPTTIDFADLVAPFTVVWGAGVAASGIPGDYLQPMNRWLLERLRCWCCQHLCTPRFEWENGQISIQNRRCKRFRAGWLRVRHLMRRVNLPLHFPLDLITTAYLWVCSLWVALLLNLP